MNADKRRWRPIKPDGFVLLPFNGTWWFTGYVVYNPINPPDLVDDAVGNAAQELRR